MTAAIQDTFDAVLGAVVRDWRPSRVESREAIRLAVMKAATAEHGLVHIATVRLYLPAWVVPAQIGSYINALVRAGYLKPTGRVRRNGGTGARNASKPAEVRRLVRPIPPGDPDTRTS